MDVFNFFKQKRLFQNYFIVIFANGLNQKMHIADSKIWLVVVTFYNKDHINYEHTAIFKRKK